MKPRVGISACLLGQAVRYDGGHKYQSLIVDQLASKVELVPFCPEVGAGLGTPRPAVQLVVIDDIVRMRGVVDPCLDVTDAVQHWIESNLPKFRNLDSFIVKARSPSCGAGNTPVFNAVGEQLPVASGLFAVALQQFYPDMLIVQEEDLQTPRKLLQFYSKFG